MTYRPTFPFAGILCMIFITLRLTNQIDWSWWWVLSPLWITLLVALALGAIVIIFQLLTEMRK